MRVPVLAVMSSARVAWARADAWGRTPVPAEAGLDLDALLDAVPAADRPWLQCAVRAAVTGASGWLRRIPDRAGGWGAGRHRARCSW